MSSFIPQTGAFQILRGPERQDVTLGGEIQEGDIVTGPWQRYVDRELFVPEVLKLGEGVTLDVHGRLWSARPTAGEDWVWLLGADTLTKKAPLTHGQFRADYGYVGSLGSAGAYRKRKFRWGVPFNPQLMGSALPNGLTVCMPGQSPRRLEDGDVLICRGRSEYGIWRRARVERHAAIIFTDEVDLVPEANVRDFFDSWAKPAGAGPLRIVRNGQNVTAQRLILPGDVVYATWQLSTPNDRLCRVVPLAPNESVKLRAPWGEIYDSKAIVDPQLLVSVPVPSDQRIVSKQWFDKTYVAVGTWGDILCYRQWRGHMETAVTSVEGSLTLQNSAGERTELRPGRTIVYQGDGNYAAWNQGGTHEW